MTSAEPYLLKAARELVPFLAERAEATEEGRRLDDESFRALHGNGLLSSGTQLALRGHGVSVRTAIEVCAELARGCAASSCVTGIAYGGALFASQLPDPVRRSVWGAAPDA